MHRIVVVKGLLSLTWLLAWALGGAVTAQVSGDATVGQRDPAAQKHLSPFTQEAPSRGLHYTMQPYPQAAGNWGFGSAFADLDGDGDPDVVLVGAANGRVGLFENDGTGHFRDRSAGSGLAPLPEACGVSAADVDGDGDLDLLLTQTGQPNVLARNDGDFAFTDVAAAAGLQQPAAASEGAAFADFDGDGWLDVYIANYRAVAPDPRSRLFRNQGDGVFLDVSAAQGAADDGYGFQPVWIDFDRDGDQDLYLSNDKATNFPFLPNRLWRNDGGQLVDISAGSGSDVAMESMGLAAGDFDGDLWPDIYCTNTPGAGGLANPLLLNQHDNTFVDQAFPAGVANPWLSWGAVFFDYDNDGRTDLYVNNQISPNALYDCDATWPCPNVAGLLDVADGNFASFSTAVADVDDDGDLDLLRNDLGVPVQLFINHEGEKRSWIKLRVVGPSPNVHAVGARVDIRVGNRWSTRQVLAGGNGYKGQHDLTIHFGLGTAAVVDEVLVTWPGGQPTRTLLGLEAGRTHVILPPAP